MKSMGAQSSNKLQWLDFEIGQQDSSSNNGHQGNMPYCPSWKWNEYHMDVLDN